MSDTPQEIKATVFKQGTIKLQEIGKSAALAGITAALSIIMASINAGEFPTNTELLTALKFGGMAMAAAIIKYWTNPTTTVIKGIHDPVTKVTDKPTVAPADSVITKETP